jgi:hypothetical protein
VPESRWEGVEFGSRGQAECPGGGKRLALGRAHETNQSARRRGGSSSGSSRCRAARLQWSTGLSLFGIRGNARDILVARSGPTILHGAR